MKSIIRPKKQWCLATTVTLHFSQVHLEILTLISKLIFHSDLNTFLTFFISSRGGCVTNKCFGSNLDLSLTHSLTSPSSCPVVVSLRFFRNKFLTFKFLHNICAFSKSFINYREFSATCHVLSRFIYHWH